ncbi:MAG TPA: TaqI-like C-terminal specificity domain-containing protein [Candidatus Ozemobacteraceae bacterium]|nr:TaqI-like C-terminal specificity domain-containing protein [Candidatus Ozemobacteraceae bacterium]
MESSLSHWFTRTLAAAYHHPPVETPTAALEQCGIDPSPFPWLSNISPASYPLRGDRLEQWPDLEQRQRSAKRTHGQYFTPEVLVTHLLQTLAPLPTSGRILDPACGAGGFLVPLAGHLADVQPDTFLDRLYGYDIDPDALLICLGRLLSRFPHRGVPTLEQRDFLLSPPEDQFRLIIGNPPYRVNLPEATRTALAQRYTTTEGEKDLYTFFLEAGIGALTHDGDLVMLTSHTYLVNHQCQRIRDHLFRNHQARSLYFLPFRFFPMAPGVIPVITHVSSSRATEQALQIYDQYSLTNGWNSRHAVKPELLRSSTGLAQIRLSPDARQLFDQMQQEHQPLGNLARVGVGIQESVTRGRQISRFVRATKDSDADVPVLRGREIDQFKVQWGGNYLTYGPHLTYPGPEEIFREPKILYQNLRNESLPLRLVAALDTDGFFPKNSLSFIARPTPPFTLEFLVGLLNSPLVNAWFAGRYYSFHITVTQVRSIPIPTATEPLRHEIEHLVRQLKNTELETREGERLQSHLSELVIRCYFPGEPIARIRHVLGLG